MPMTNVPQAMHVEHAIGRFPNGHFPLACQEMASTMLRSCFVDEIQWYLHILLILVAFAGQGCGRADTQRSYGNAQRVETVASFADACRRIELLGYKHSEESAVSGQFFVKYVKASPEAEYSVQIVQSLADKKLELLLLHAQTNEPTFTASDGRARIWGHIEADVSKLLRDKQDYIRALSGMEKSTDDSSRMQGVATTEDGWRIQISEYLSYDTRLAGTQENKITMAMVILTQL
jgi:hypothetical protein